MQNQTENRSTAGHVEGASSPGLMAATVGALEGAASGIERAGHGVGDRVSDAADRTALALLSGADRVRDMNARDLGADLIDVAKRHPMKAIAAVAAMAFLVTRVVTRR